MKKLTISFILIISTLTLAACGTGCNTCGNSGGGGTDTTITCCPSTPW